ncbi:hypothetical protein SHKM778_65240 [Streptomyces sp. KM77-8]|uniref:Uncharacterized protein n=1 Tax=Streptomyces haneummycinicus TaxID=3074435 RepID=A0AAT9HRD3_9ACTN
MPYGHREGVTEEDHDLAGGDGVALRLVLDRLEDHEQRVVVHLQFGSLMGLEGVLDGQRMQSELLRDQAELVRRRLVQPDPDESPAARASSSASEKSRGPSDRRPSR